MDGVGRSISVGFGSIVKVVAAVAVFEKLNAAVHDGIREFAEHQQVTAQTAAALKSTGSVAGVTARQIDALGLKLSNLSGIDDEVVQAGENVLLSFTNIRDSVGKNNDIFTRATKAVVDYAARTGKDVPVAAVLLGRALQDPATKLTALSRAGIVFTKSQIEAVRAIEKSKGVIAAQKVVLEALAQRFGGAAKAAGQTLPGQLNVLKDRFKDLAGSIVGTFAPAFATAVGALTGFVRRISEAQTIHAKLNIVWDGIQDAARGAESALTDAVSGVDWTKVWAGARGIADGLQARFETIDWGKIGGMIGQGISDAVKVALPAAKEMAQRISDVVASIDFVKFGKKVGPGLAAALVTAFATLTDPSFWVHNWDLALAVGLTAFGGSVGRIAGKLGEVLVRPLAKVGGDAALAIAGAFERFGPRIAGAVLGSLLRIPGAVEGALRPLVAVVGRVFGRLGPVARFTVKVLGIQAAIDVVAGLIKRIAALISGGLDNAWEAMKRGAIKAVLGIIEPFTHLPGFLGGGPFRALKDQLQAQLDKMTKAAADAAKSISTSLSQINTQTSAQSINQAIAEHVAQAQRRAAPATPRTTTAPAHPPPSGLGSTAATAPKGFTLPINLQLEQAKAAASGSQAAILKAARDIAAFVRSVIPKLHGDKLVGAYNELAQVTGTITASVQAAADKAKQAAEQAKAFTVPLSLQVAQARLEALGKPFTSVLQKIKLTAEKALKSGRLGLQGQLDAWNTILGINQQLQNAVDGFNFTLADRKIRFRDRSLSQGDRADSQRSKPASTRQLTYAPTIVSTDLRDAQKLNQREFFRFKQRFA